MKSNSPFGRKQLPTIAQSECRGPPEGSVRHVKNSLEALAEFHGIRV